MEASPSLSTQVTNDSKELSKIDENLTQTDEIESLPKESASLLNVEENIIKQQTSDVDLNTILGFESEEYSESKHESSKHESEVVCPLGEDYIPLTPKIIEEKKKLLGAIRLYWPVSPDISLRSFPESYKLNSNKEKVLLLYAENFRKQYHGNFPTKKPLLLAAENECGVQTSLKIDNELFSLKTKPAVVTMGHQFYQMTEDYWMSRSRSKYF